MTVIPTNGNGDLVGRNENALLKTLGVPESVDRIYFLAIILDRAEAETPTRLAISANGIAYSCTNFKAIVQLSQKQSSDEFLK